MWCVWCNALFEVIGFTCHGALLCGVYIVTSYMW